MSEKVWVWGVAVILAVLIFAFHSAETSSLAAQRQTADEIRKRLLYVDSIAKPGKVMRGLIREVFPHLRGRVGADSTVSEVIARGLRGISSGSVEVYLTDVDENLLWSNQPGVENFNTAQQRLSSSGLSDLGLRTPIWRVTRLPTKPHLLAVWRVDRTIKKPLIAGALFLVDVRKLNSEFLIKFLLGRWAERSVRYGYWNRITGGVFNLPPEIESNELPGLLQKFSRQSGHAIQAKNHLLVMVPVSGAAMMMGIARKPSLRLPLWFPVFLTAILFLKVGWQRSQDRNTLSLRLFVGMTLTVAAGIPMLLTLMFWSFFEENRTLSLEKEQFSKLEQHLINIDRKLPEEIRRREGVLKRVSQDVESSLDNLEPHIRALNVMEIENRVFDSGFFISSQGAQLRGFGFLDTTLRQIARFSWAERRARMQELLESGLFSPLKWLKTSLEMDLDPDSVQRIWDCISSPQHQAKMEAGVSALGKIMVQRFNQDAVKHEGSADSGGKQDMVVGAMIDSQTGDMIQTALANRRKALPLGTGEISSFVYGDVLKDAHGKGQYFMLNFMDLRGIQGHFLNDIFQASQTWPSGIEYAGESSFCFTNFPWKNRHPELRSYLGKLVPPRRIISETTWLGGKKVLLSAYAAKNLKHFVLFAVSPYTVIENRQEELRREMAVILLMMILLVIGFTGQLNRSIIAPAEHLLEGIRAIERKEFEHRIPLTTGDEWDEIAESFNRTIGSLEELEVARVVQAQILPQEIISVQEAGFLGRSLMTSQVGGDYFDAIANEDGSLNFVIGDVTGHGVSAALVVAMAKSAFHSIHRRGVRSPCEMLVRMNAMIIKSLSKKKSLTMQIGLYQPGGKLIFANAGHPYPYLLSANKEVKQLIARGMVLGISAKARFEEIAVDLCEEGGTLVMFTDGIIEQMNHSGKRFGLEGFQSALQGFSSVSSISMISEIQEAVGRFAAGRPLEDDVTVALFSWKGVEKS